MQWWDMSDCLRAFNEVLRTLTMWTVWIAWCTWLTEGHQASAVILLHWVTSLCCVDFDWQAVNGRIRIALIGQSQFAVDVYRLLRQNHDIVGVFTVPDVNGRPDPLGTFLFTKDVKIGLFSQSKVDCSKPNINRSSKSSRGCASYMEYEKCSVNC